MTATLSLALSLADEEAVAVLSSSIAVSKAVRGALAEHTVVEGKLGAGRYLRQRFRLRV